MVCAVFICIQQLFYCLCKRQPLLIDNWGAHFDNQPFHVSVMAGLILEFFMLFFIFTAVLWAEMSECEAYWLMNFVLIINWVHTKKESW